MLNRESQLTLGKRLETGYVEEKAASKALRDASSVSNHASVRSRQPVVRPKRAHTDERQGVGSVVPSDLSLTVPRGDIAPAKSDALPEKSGSASVTARVSSNRVFVLSKHKAPLMPMTPRRARQLLDSKRAVVHKLNPFTIRLKDREDGVLQPVVLSLDPGSKHTGGALCRVGNNGTLFVLFLFELQHRGRQISEALTARAAYRRNRRSRKLRYRAPRFSNRTKPTGWLPPSLRHRVESTMSQVKRLHQICPFTEIRSELVRFDMQLLENSEISGVEYQRGELAGYEVKEYLLEKWGRACIYCGKEGVPLQKEHILAKSRSGSNRVSNLTLSCGPCNQKKGAQPLEAFLKKKPALLAKIKAAQKKPLRDAAAVNATRLALVKELTETGIPVSTYSGGRTKWNRTRLGIPKTHALDAVCVGNVPAVKGWRCAVLEIKSMGRGQYRRTLVNEFGAPESYLPRQKQMFGFQTGDRVRAVVPPSCKKSVGTHVGRVAVRSDGGFAIKTAKRLLGSVNYRYCTLVARGDGYSYALRTAFPPRDQSLGFHAFGEL